jgi:hypothetical protein
MIEIEGIGWDLNILRVYFIQKKLSLKELSVIH